jgi:hypothetical protein
MKKLFLMICFIFIGISLSMAAEAPSGTGSAPAKEATLGEEVVRAVFATEVKDRAPVDEITQTGTDVKKLFFFTELKGLSDQEVTHRWEYQGKVMSEVKLPIKAARWRVWSSKTFNPGWVGEWKVSVVDSSGKVLIEKTFTYGK